MSRTVKGSRRTNFILGDHSTDYKTTQSTNYENR